MSSSGGKKPPLPALLRAKLPKKKKKKHHSQQRESAPSSSPYKRLTRSHTSHALSHGDAAADDDATPAKTLRKKALKKSGEGKKSTRTSRVAFAMDELENDLGDEVVELSEDEAVAPAATKPPMAPRSIMRKKKVSIDAPKDKEDKDGKDKGKDKDGKDKGKDKGKKKKKMNRRTKSLGVLLPVKKVEARVKIGKKRPPRPPGSGGGIAGGGGGGGIAGGGVPSDALRRRQSVEDLLKTVERLPSLGEDEKLLMEMQKAAGKYAAQVLGADAKKLPRARWHSDQIELAIPVSAGHKEYAESHQLVKILRQFTLSVLEQRPFDIRQYALRYFEQTVDQPALRRQRRNSLKNLLGEASSRKRHYKAKPGEKDDNVRARLRNAIKADPLIGFVRDEATELLIEAAEFVTFDKEEPVYEAGDHSKFVYYIDMGQVDVVMDSTDLAVESSDVMRGGTLFGLMELLMDLERSCSVIPTRATRCWCWDWTVLRKIVFEDGQLAHADATAGRATRSPIDIVMHNGPLYAKLSTVDRYTVMRERRFLEQVGSEVATLERENEVLQGQLTTLADERDMAREAAEGKQRYLATMSHEIRTPLNGVIGMTDLLFDTDLNEVQHEYVSLMRLSSDALLSNINNILDLSKIEAGRMELEQLQFSPWELVEGACDLISVRVVDKDVEVLHYFDDSIPRCVVGDVNRIRQILFNMLSNACKFTDAGHILTRMKMFALTSQRMELQFSVEDTGPGIPEEGLNNLFQEYRQADKSVARTHGGTGLGLVISRSLAELMGGRLWVESTVGVGTTFFFTVVVEMPPHTPSAPTTPVLEGARVQRRRSLGSMNDLDSVKTLDDIAAASPPHPGRRRRRTIVERVKRVGGKRVLVIVNQAQVLTIVKQMIRAWDMDLDGVASEERARQKVDEQQYDVLVVDEAINNGTGRLLARELRRLQDVPVVLLQSLHRRTNTGEDAAMAALSEEEQEAVRQAIAFTVHKPVKRLKLLDAITRALRMGGALGSSHRLGMSHSTSAGSFTTAKDMFATGELSGSLGSLTLPSSTVPASGGAGGGGGGSGGGAAAGGSTNAASAGAAAGAAPKAASNEPPPGLHILVCEDDPTSQKVVGSMLRRRGHTFVIMEDGLAGVLRASSEEFDLIFMDYHMPRMDGIEACRRIRSEENGANLVTPIVALTADALSSAQKKFIDAGSSDFLTKPLRKQPLYDMVEKWRGKLHGEGRQPGDDDEDDEDDDDDELGDLTQPMQQLHVEDL